MSRLEALRRVRGEAGPSDFDPRNEALTESPVPGLTSGPEETRSSADTESVVSVLRYDDDAIALNATSSQDALLVTSELADPGWSARIDGALTPTLVVNAGFRAVSLPAGSHTVEFVYRPPGARIGLAVSLTALCALIGLWIGAGRRARRTGATAGR
jgi:hypothetical protein